MPFAASATNTPALLYVNRLASRLARWTTRRKRQDDISRFDFSMRAHSALGHVFRPAEFPPCLGERLRLDQQALPLVALARALRPRPPRERRVSGAEERQVVETAAAQARRPGILHDEEIAACAAAVA